MFHVGDLVSLFLFASSLAVASSDHPGLGEWSEWSECSKSCDRGLRTRNRTCVTALCNTTLQTQSCSTKPCHDVQTQIIMISVVTVAVISIVTTVLVIIFYVKGNKTRKPRASSLETSKRLRTITLDRTANASTGLCVENRVFQLRNALAVSRGSLQTSHTTLKEFGESVTPRTASPNLAANRNS